MRAINELTEYTKLTCTYNSFKKSYAGERILENVKNILHGIIGYDCCKKLISCETDGAHDMTGWYQSAVAKQKTFYSSGFLGVWLDEHQLDLIVQGFITKILGE